jgi:hypothetical protein
MARVDRKRKAAKGPPSRRATTSNTLKTKRSRTKAKGPDSVELDSVLRQVEGAVREAYASIGPVQLTVVVQGGKPRARIGMEDVQEVDLPPIDVAAEEALLGALLYDNGVLDDVGSLQPGDFSEPFHARLFTAIRAEVAKGRLVEPATLAERLSGDPAYQAFGGLDYLIDLVDRAPPVRETAALARLLRDLAEERDPTAAQILAGPSMLSADDFAELIGAARETVRQKLKRREVLGLQGAKRGMRYPSWQVSGDGALLPHLGEIFDMLGDSPWTVYRFLLQASPALGGRRPLDALRSGDAGAVVEAARAQAEAAAEPTVPPPP